MCVCVLCDTFPKEGQHKYPFTPYRKTKVRILLQSSLMNQCVCSGYQLGISWGLAGTGIIQRQLQYQQHHSTQHRWHLMKEGVLKHPAALANSLAGSRVSFRQLNWPPSSRSMADLLLLGSPYYYFNLREWGPCASAKFQGFPKLFELFI